MMMFIDNVFLRSDSFAYSNPELALEVYKKAKDTNPTINYYYEKETVDALSKCLEKTKLDINRFLSSHGANINYSPWLWAKIVSNSENNPELVLSLICLGGYIPGEKIPAIKSFHKFWKENRNVPFNGCDYAAGNYTLAICSRNERY